MNSNIYVGKYIKNKYGTVGKIMAYGGGLFLISIVKCNKKHLIGKKKLYNDMYILMTYPIRSTIGWDLKFLQEKS